MKDESKDRNKEVKAQRDDESTNEDDDEYTSEQELFWTIHLRDSQVIWILDRGSLCGSWDKPENHPSSSLQNLSRQIQWIQLAEVQFDGLIKTSW